MPFLPFMCCDFYICNLGLEDNGYSIDGWSASQIITVKQVHRKNFSGAILENVSYTISHQLFKNQNKVFGEP